VRNSWSNLSLTNFTLCLVLSSLMVLSLGQMAGIQVTSSLARPISCFLVLEMSVVSVLHDRLSHVGLKFPSILCFMLW
jgi:hypothetical protein